MRRRPFDIPTVGLVGGPGNGKSAVWKAFVGHPHVACVPEAPTLLQGFGLWHPADAAQFEADLDRLRWNLETMAAWSAHMTGAQLLLADRIFGEGAAVYAHSPVPADVLMARSTLLSYRALIVYALPPPEVWYFYRADNGTRTEEAYEQARGIHERILSFVSHHPRVYIVENQASFATKLSQGVEIVHQLLAEVLPANIP